jgi:hypothetical protein
MTTILIFLAAGLVIDLLVWLCAAYELGYWPASKPAIWWPVIWFKRQAMKTRRWM